MDSSEVPESLYLYGRIEFLGKFVGIAELAANDQGLRLCDILHYKIMENEKVRDDESVRKFVLHKDHFTIDVNGITIDKDSMTDHPAVEVAVPRCFCLCMSKLADSDHMYEKFNADICLRVDVANLIYFLTNVVGGLYKGLRVLHGPIVYFPPVLTTPPPSDDGLIFWKSDVFSDEQEYRIAIKTPSRYVVSGDERHDVFEDGKPSYIHVGHKDKTLWNDLFPEFAVKSCRGFQPNQRPRSGR